MSRRAFYGVPEKMTRRLAGVVVGTQGLAVFFGALVARALAAAQGSDTSNTFLTIGTLLAVVCILDAGLMRRPWGITLGWALQLATIACALIVPAMLLVGLLFGALWVTALVQGGAMDEHTRRVDAQWYAVHGTSPTGPSSGESASPGSSAVSPGESSVAPGESAGVSTSESAANESSPPTAQDG